jgi:hypothetical protein
MEGAEGNWSHFETVLGERRPVGWVGQWPLEKVPVSRKGRETLGTRRRKKFREVKILTLDKYI